MPPDLYELTPPQNRFVAHRKLILLALGVAFLVGVLLIVLLLGNNKSAVSPREGNYTGSFIELSNYTPQAETLVSLANLRLGGQTRTDSSIEVSKFRFPNGAKSAYVINGTRYADVVLASTLANDGPLLYLPDKNIDTRIVDEIQRLKPEKIVIVGGSDVVEEAVYSRLSGFAPVERLAGVSRIQTAIEVAKKRTSSGTGAVYLVNGYEKASAALLQPHLLEGPVYFTNNSELPTNSLSELRAAQPSAVILLGGTAVVPQSVEDSIKQYFPNANITRFGGPDRFATSIAVSKARYADGAAKRIYLVNAVSETDTALAGTLNSTGDSGPVLYVEKDRLPQGICDEVVRLGANEVFVVGGEHNVSNTVAAFLTDVASGKASCNDNT